jgi:Ala-tRNA(Pro) deacylase
MPGNSITEYLNKHHIAFSTISHTPAYTASQTAEAAHIPGRNMAKIVMVKIDGRLAIIVLPANVRLDIANFKAQYSAEKVEIAHEYEFNDKFHDCELGEMPPIGDLYKMDIYLADSLTRNNWLAFNAGTHSELIRMSTSDFLNLVHPNVLARC